VLRAKTAPAGVAPWRAASVGLFPTLPSPPRATWVLAGFELQLLVFHRLTIFHMLTG
jgi:hypothetical protein